MIANFAALPVKPGSMGKPLPDIDAAIVKRTTEGGIQVVTERAVPGVVTVEDHLKVN